MFCENDFFKKSTALLKEIGVWNLVYGASNLYLLNLFLWYLAYWVIFSSTF